MSRKNAIGFMLASLSILAVLFSSSQAFARPQPDYTFYGTIFVNDVPLTAADTGYTATLEVDGVELVAYTMGSDSNYEDYYVLKVPMDDDPEVGDKGQAGDTAYVYVNGVAIDENPVTLGAYGQTDFWDIRVTATAQYTLTVSTAGSGTVTLDPAGGSYDDGTVVTLTAEHGQGWEFSGWSRDLSGSENPATIIMDSDKNVTATFTEIPVPQYTLTVSTAGSGSVTLDPAGGTYDEGTQVKLTAEPDQGWGFSDWSGDVRGAHNPATITMDSDKNVTATFNEVPAIQYALSVTTVGSGSVTLSPAGGTYDEGIEVTLTAEPDEGWKFSSWSGHLSGSENPATITMDSDKNVTATFTEVPTTCFHNSDCVPGSYCKKPEGDCDDEGQCTPKPLDCPVIVGGQVCGCDRQTYLSECDAAQAGVSVAYGGYCNADVAVTKIGEPNPLFVGNGHDNTLTYTLAVSNAGPEDAGDVTLTDDVPLDNPEFSTDGGSSWHTWVGSENLGTILAGGSQEILIRGTVDYPSDPGVFTITNTATVSSDRFDYELSNNTVTVFNTIITGDTPVAPFPLLEAFESGEIANYWTTNSTGAGRINVTAAYGPHGGKYHLTMDSAWWSTPSLNELVLTVDLSGHAGVMLSFWHKEFNDEDNVMPDSFIGSHNSDGVAISADGTTWYKVQGLTGADGISSGWKDYEVDLDAVAVAAGISYNGAFKIKFQQYGKDPIVSTTFPFSDGFAFDDIGVYQGIIDNDSDGDGLPDDWEQEYFGNLFQGPGDDYDVDGLDNLGEWQQGTDPTDSDTDADQMPDGWEAQYGLNPLDPCDAGEDLDGDGSTNLEEYLAGTDPSGATASFPFVEDFETGDLENYWTTYSTNRGSIQVTALNGPASGSYHLTMDSSHYMNLSLNELVLSINLASQSGVTLRFYHKQFNDDSNVMPSSFTGSHNSDGVAISDDGATWYKVQGLTSADGTSSVWQCYEVDLDAAAMAAGISYNSAFKIKFQQYGKDPIVSSTFPFSDGFAFDDIEVAEMH